MSVNITAESAPNTAMAVMTWTAIKGMRSRSPHKASAIGIAYGMV